MELLGALGIGLVAAAALAAYALGALLAAVRHASLGLALALAATAPLGASLDRLGAWWSYNGILWAAAAGAGAPIAGLLAARTLATPLARRLRAGPIVAALAGILALALALPFLGPTVFARRGLGESAASYLPTGAALALIATGAAAYVALLLVARGPGPLGLALRVLATAHLAAIGVAIAWPGPGATLGTVSAASSVLAACAIAAPLALDPAPGSTSELVGKAS